VVTVQECKPYSKSKTWKLLSEEQAIASAEEIQEVQS
jgi:ribosomal protein S17